MDGLETHLMFSCIEFWIYLHISSLFKSILLYRGHKIMFTAFLPVGNAISHYNVGLISSLQKKI